MRMARVVSTDQRKHEPMTQSSRQYVSDVAFTPSVKAVQARLGSRNGYAGMEQRGGWSDAITDDLRAFIAERDSFYLGTANAQGRPYIQHRGGPPGFLKVLDDHTLAFADFGGNRQYISVGNMAENNQAFIFLMDYANRRRVKVWGRGRVVEDDPALLQRVSDPEYTGEPQRVFVFHVEAWDANCPQHITRCLTQEEIDAENERLHERIAKLEAENDRLRRAERSEHA